MDQDILEQARRFAADHREEQLALLRELGQIPAPSYQEDRRAAFVLDWLTAQGAQDAATDRAKNVVCKIGCEGKADLVVFAAHTDIVFPDTEPLPMEERDGRLYAPGIGDDTANLVNLLLCAKFLLTRQIEMKTGVLIVCNACEEGLGNLAGTRQLFADYGERIRAFYSFDGYMPCCTCTAVGSYRYRVTCRTQGGHSYADWGRPNAIAVLSALVGELYKIKPPAQAKTTYNVGRFEGGTTVNSIAQEASMLYEFRSTSQVCLKEMEGKFQAAVDACQGLGGELDVELIGMRPGDGPLDRAVLAEMTGCTVEAIQAVCGCEAEISPQSTDSNVPLSMGIPANTLGTVRGGLAHTRQEWVDLDSLTPGLELALTIVLQYKA